MGNHLVSIFNVLPVEIVILAGKYWRDHAILLKIANWLLGLATSQSFTGDILGGGTFSFYGAFDWIKICEFNIRHEYLWSVFPTKSKFCQCLGAH